MTAPLSSYGVEACFALTTSGFDECFGACTALEKSGVPARVLRAGRMKTAQGVFDETSAALQFPPYFGYNWPAYHECLSELDWLPIKRGLVIMVLGMEDLLSNEDSRELSTFIRIFAHAVDELSRPIGEGQPWDRPPVAVQVVFQLQPEAIVFMRSELMTHGYQAADVTFPYPDSF